VDAPQKPQVFTDADKETAPQVFDDSERQRCCCWCKHMVVNPFGQRCGVTNCFTEATNLCEHFEKKDVNLRLIKETSSGIVASERRRR